MWAPKALIPPLATNKKEIGGFWSPIDDGAGAQGSAPIGEVEEPSGVVEQVDAGDSATTTAATTTAATTTAATPCSSRSAAASSS